jgi:hypothetical protein
MRSKTVAQLLMDLGVTKSHSRPYTPTDNAFSEAHFKTLKYRPDYPDEFEGEFHARQWARDFFRWYNQEHHHTGLALMTPATVHYGQAETVREKRQEVLNAAYAAHPERFVGGRPTPPRLPEEVWVNQPRKEHEETSHSSGSESSDMETETHARSSGPMLVSLDELKHPARLEQTLDPLERIGISHCKLQPELSQSR